MTELTFTKDTYGFYTSSFHANGRCHVQINKDVSDAGVTVFEAAVDGEDYVVFQPTYDSSGILAEIDLPAGFNVRIKSTTPVLYASIIGNGEYIPPTPVLDDTWLYFTMPQGGTVSLTKNGTPTEVTLEYSLDNGSTWTEWVESGNVRSLTLAAGQTMHVRNTSETPTRFSTGVSDYYSFAFTNDTYAGGNTNSLLCKNPQNDILSIYCYRRLFFQAQKLVTTPLLPAENITAYCYQAMFQLSGITTPAELPATELKTYCYAFMYNNCNNLQYAPNLPAKIATISCYYSMFNGDSLINEIHCEMTDISAANCLNSWLDGVASTGDFYCPAELTIPTGASGIPSGWTRHDI